MFIQVDPHVYPPNELYTYIYIYMYGTQDRRVQLRYKQTGSKQCKRWREPAQPSNDVWGVLQMGGPKDTIFVSILSISKYTNMI